MIAAIIACEIGFWVFLAAGLLARYGLRRPRLGAALLVCVPIVDLALLVLTGVDLRRGSEPETAHALAAVYLGFSVAFGHGIIHATDVRVAHRLAGGPAPAPAPPRGTPARLRKEWHSFGLALLAASITTVVLVGLVWLAGPAVESGPLLDVLPAIAIVLAVWFATGPLWEWAHGLVAPPQKSSAEAVESRGASASKG